MSTNILTIDIDPEREDPIKINKPQEMMENVADLDVILKNDIKDITITSLYLASMLNEQDESKMLTAIERMIKDRRDEIAGTD